MKTTLSFWKRVYNGLCLTGRVLDRVWQRSKFDFIPTEKNLLISFWHVRDSYRRNRAEDSVYDFLDVQVREIEKYIADLRQKQEARELYGYFLQALKQEYIREMVVEFLESPSPEEGYLPVMKAIRGAWRMGDGGTPGVGVRRLEIPGRVDEVRGKEKAIEAGIDEKVFNAKAYIIAVQLWLELEGKGDEFESLVRRVADLRIFIREKFGVERLPGRLEEFKGYSYKPVLNDKSSARKGQLRMPFRQIMEHPEVFGEAVAGRARKIVEEFFT